MSRDRKKVSKIVKKRGRGQFKEGFGIKGSNKWRAVVSQSERGGGGPPALYPDLRGSTTHHDTG